MNCEPTAMLEPPLTSMPVRFRWVYEQEAELVQDWWRRKTQAIESAEEKEVARQGRREKGDPTTAAAANPGEHASRLAGEERKIRRVEPLAPQHGLLLAIHRDSDSSSGSSSATSSSSSDSEEDTNEARKGDRPGKANEESPGAPQQQQRQEKEGSRAESTDRRARRRASRREAREDLAEANSGRVPLRAAAAVPFPFNRASGVDYNFSSTDGAERGSHSNEEDGQAAAKAGGGTRTAATPSLAEVPCGEAFYTALRARWSAPAAPGSAAAAEVAALPPLAEEEDLDDSLIMDCISDAHTLALDPPVPLGYMIDSLIPDWEAEGLYEIARKREAQAQQVPQGR